MDDTPHRPRMSEERAALLREWHDGASRHLHALGAHDVRYLGLDLHVPEQVFPPTPMSDLLGREVLARVEATSRVLDMGTGAGANALLAARVSNEVVAVDVNPLAVAAAEQNAVRNGLAERIRFLVGDLFAPVDGAFDVVVFDPPFRWFTPTDLLERACADENYSTLTRFVTELPSRLRPGGEALVAFGTTGDLAYLDELIERSGLRCEVVAERRHPDGVERYVVDRLTAPDGPEAP